MKNIKKIIMMILLLTMTQQLCSCNSNNKSLDNNNSSLVDESKTHTLSFDTDGGNVIAAIIQKSGTSVKLPLDPIKEGYTFIGWDKKVPDTMPNSDMTFKAQWIEGTMKFSIERNGTAAITSYKGETKELVLPDVIYNEYKLVEIRNFAFSGCTTLTNIIIPSSVTTIGYGAFQNCTSLTNITIPSSVKTIMGFSVFFGCPLLTIYCEAESQPSGWDANWNDGRANVYWNASGQITIDGLVYTYNKSNYKATVIDYIDDLPEQFIIPKTIIIDEKIYYVTSYDFSELENLKYKKIVDAAVMIIYFADKQLTKTQYNLPGEMTVKEGEKSYQVTIEWAGEPAERFSFERSDNMVYANVNLPNVSEKAISSKLVATAKYESATATREFPVILMPTEKIDSKEKTIAEVKNATVGQYVTVTGVVVNARNNNKGYYIVDETGAIYVYDYNRTSGVGTTIAWGTKVTLTAMRGENKGQYNQSSVQLVYNETATITAMGKEAMPLTGAQDLTITQFKAWKTDGTEDYAGGFYKVRGYLAKYTPNGKDYSNYELIDDAGNYIQFFAADSTVYATELADYFAEGKTTTSGETTKTTAQFDVYLAVYDRQVSKNKWRVVPLAFVEVA